MAIELEMSEAMIDEVIKDYERDNPGKDGWKMTSKEFADRMMEKIKATAKITPDIAGDVQ